MNVSIGAPPLIAGVGISFNPCYMSRPKRSVGRAQRGTERSGVSLSQEHYIKERGKNLFPLKVIAISNKWTIQNSEFLPRIPDFD